MAELKAVSNHPDWFPLSDQEKQTVIDRSFEKEVATHPDFQTMSSEQQERAKFGYQQHVESAALNSRHNPDNVAAAAAQQVSDESSYARNLIRTGIESHASTLARAGLAIDGSATHISKLLQKRINKPVTEDSKKLGAAVNKVVKATDRDGFWSDTKAIAEFVFKDLPQNLAGIGEVAMESAASMTTHGMGAWGGARIGGAAGSVIPGIGTAAGATIGAATGMVAASTADAGTQKYLDKFGEALDAAGLDYTPANIQLLLDKPEWMAETKKAAITYGGVLGLVDAALGGFASRISTLSTKAARKAAMGTIDDASEAVIRKIAQKSEFSPAQIKDDIISGRARAILSGKDILSESGEIVAKGRTLKSKLKSKLISYAGEVAGEPASEAAATASIGDEIKAEDLIYETLGGIGAGPYGAAISTAAFGSKIGKDKTTAFTKKILASTPESRAASKEQKAATAEAKKQSKSRDDVQFKKDVENIEPTDPKIDEYADTKHESYDPIKAVTILAKSTDIDAVDKARKVHNDMFEAIQETSTRITELTDIPFKDLSEEQKVELGNLKNLQEYQLKTKETVLKQVDKMKARVAKEASDKVVKPIDPETATPEEVKTHIIDSLGSKSATTIADIKKLQQRTDLTKTQQLFLGATMAAEIARENIAKSAFGPKSMESVGHDIYHGLRGSKFKGIDAYQQAISFYLSDNKNDVKSATVQLEGLKKFRDAHQKKSDNLISIFETIQKGEELSVDQKTIYKQMQLENPNLKIHENSGKLVNIVKQEAAALNVEVKRAEAAFEVHGDKTVPSVSVTPKKAPVSESEAPVDYSEKSDRALNNLITNLEKLDKKDITPQREVQLKEAKRVLAKRAEDAAISLVEIPKIEPKEKVIIPEKKVEKPVADTTDVAEEYITSDDLVLTAEVTLTDIMAEAGAGTHKKISKDGYVSKDSVNLIRIAHPWAKDHNLGAIMGMLKNIVAGTPIPVNAPAQQSAYEDWLYHLQGDRGFNKLLDPMASQEAKYLAKLEEQLSKVKTIIIKGRRSGGKSKVYKNALVKQEQLKTEIVEAKIKLFGTEETVTDQKPDEDIKTSTDEEITDNLAVLDKADFGNLNVEFTDDSGKQIKKYDDAMAEIKTEITELENILTCIKG